MKRKLTAAAIAGAMLLSLVGGVFAQPNFKPAEVGNPQTGDNHRTVTVPATAVEVAPALFDLGTSTDVDGRLVQGYMFIHYRDAFGHKPGHDKGGGKKGNGGGENKCFSFLARDAKWKTVEPWVVNTANASGLAGDFVFGNLTADIAQWEDAADGIVDGVEGADVLGDGSTTLGTLVADTVSPDGNNEVYFADIDSEGAIAVTIVWGFFNGPPFTRELVEWDQVYDDVDFDWSSTGEAGKMDFGNIAQHELGHSVGMGHPDDSCTEETMYRFAAFGETIKRDLNAGDIAGIQKLYK